MRLRDEPPVITQQTRSSRKRKSPSSTSAAEQQQAPPPPPIPQPMQHVLPPPHALMHPPLPPGQLPPGFAYAPVDYTPGGLPPGVPPPPPPPSQQALDQGRGSGSAGGRTLSSSKRAEQNRKAQRAFRERRDQHVKYLESRSQLLDAALQSADEANRRWEECRALVDQLRVENAALRAALSQSLPAGLVQDKDAGKEGGPDQGDGGVGVANQTNND
ncbi:hypothetical protein FA15DRAFT_595891 [Coprinopsis marcescibilis]|uniref:BZIP domain-containing protein n=1 Tax=Coprinopsis marcescibilis TaxID=230819 RepID=A0A5C3KQB5_COPMA|nr:hypothetical protein FA15DRAFT_595891 [Coprinopsis marcescibilis]